MLGWGSSYSQLMFTKKKNIGCNKKPAKRGSWRMFYHMNVVFAQFLHCQYLILLPVI